MQLSLMPAAVEVSISPTFHGTGKNQIAGAFQDGIEWTICSVSALVFVFLLWRKTSTNRNMKVIKRDDFASLPQLEEKEVEIVNVKIPTGSVIVTFLGDSAAPEDNSLEEEKGEDDLEVGNVNSSTIGAMLDMEAAEENDVINPLLVSRAPANSPVSSISSRDTNMSRTEWEKLLSLSSIHTQQHQQQQQQKKEVKPFPLVENTHQLELNEDISESPQIVAAKCKMLHGCSRLY